MEVKKIEETIKFIEDKAKEFGAKSDSDKDKSYILRRNVGAEALKDDGAYFGFIQPYEAISGPFHDFSFTIFPSSDEKPWLLCLGVGSQGFKNDAEISTYQGWRRLFSRLIDNNGFYKTDFSDIQTGLPKQIIDNPALEHIKNTIKTYTKVLPVCQIINDPTSTDGKARIAGFLAAYARMRDWASNQKQKDNISNAINQLTPTIEKNVEKEIFDLLKERRYIILQGAPGTGKTSTAKKIAKSLDATLFFTQFHAETSYSDFIYGIRPKLDSTNLGYQEYNGVFTQAVIAAQRDSTKPVLLIIDEINRANLSNVLGPIFYLFEYQQSLANAEIEITPNLRLSEIPKNFYVIGTMNTADRSLAVVDFALKRRFAWYDMIPTSVDDKNFKKKDFNKINEIFELYATSTELNLQPGQGYFFANSEAEMQNRIRYEIYPLIREYLLEGFLLPAKDEFNNYFITRISKSLFE